MNFITDLASRGATNFLVPNVPDIGKTPLENINGPVQSANASTLAAYYNATVLAALVPLSIADHINIDIPDTYAMVDSIVADPEAYGFTDVTNPVWTGNTTDPNSGTLAAPTQAGQDQYLFWDACTRPNRGLRCSPPSRKMSFSGSPPARDRRPRQQQTRGMVARSIVRNPRPMNGIASMSLSTTLGNFITDLTGNDTTPSPTPTPGQPFPALYAFGDSLSDVGNISALLSAFAAGFAAVLRRPFQQRPDLDRGPVQRPGPRHDQAQPRRRHRFRLWRGRNRQHADHSRTRSI